MPTPGGRPPHGAKTVTARMGDEQVASVLIDEPRGPARIDGPQSRNASTAVTKASGWVWWAAWAAPSIRVIDP